MLDKLTQFVLVKINTDSDGSYKVMDSSDFLSALPSKMTADENGVANAIRFLNERRYIDVKYADSGTYCVCSLPKGRQFAESETVSEPRGGKDKRLLFGIAFAGGFTGALLGGALIAVLIALFL